MQVVKLDTSILYEASFKEAVAFQEGSRLLKLPKIVLEGAKLGQYRAVLCTDENGLSFFDEIIQEYMKQSIVSKLDKIRYIFLKIN